MLWQIILGMLETAILMRFFKGIGLRGKTGAGRGVAITSNFFNAMGMTRTNTQLLEFSVQVRAF